jgi:broad specificity phosphatase PhoE
MAMPRDLVLVRHGNSEANVIQKERKTNPDAQAPDGFFDRHDSHMRLSAEGVKQAEVTGRWLRNEFPGGFDRYYVSSLTRTIETAGRLAIGGTWNIDDRWRERDWGEYGLLSEAEQQRRYELSTRLKGQSKWYWCPPGGESLATGVRLRFEDILGTLHREQAGQSVIAVTHGETMEVARFVLERLLPKEWEDQERDKNYKLPNCQVLHFSRVNPDTQEMADHLEWRRSVCAWDESRSWHNGEWVHIDHPRRYSDDDLLGLVEPYPRLLAEQVQDA